VRKKRIWMPLKYLLCLLLIFAILLSFCGCAWLGNWFERFFFDEYAGLPPYEMGKAFDYSRDFSGIEAKMSEVRFLISKGVDYPRFAALYGELTEQDLPYIAEQTEKYSLLSDLDGSHRAWYDGYVYCRDFEREVALWLIGTEELIANSAFRERYFEGMSDQEIADHIFALKGAYSEEEKALQERIEALENSYYQSNGDPYEIYPHLVEARNQLAAMNGYDNYLAYAHAELYDRGYSMGEIDRLLGYVSVYIGDLSLKAQTRLEELEAASAKWPREDRTLYINFYDRGFQRYGAKQYLDRYAEAMGGSFQSAYDALWNGGYYFFGNDTDNAYTGAYQGYFESEGVPYLYFGPYYQDVMTVAHEFGHYYHALKGRNGDFDLLELHSQGNEMLFLSYLRQHRAELGISDACIERITAYWYADMLDIIVTGAAVYAFERQCYEAADPGTIDLAAALTAALAPYGIDTKDNRYYLLENAISSPGYYISYTVSAVAALTLGFEAERDFSHAAAVYEQLCSVADDVKLTGALAAVSLGTPFEEKTYQTIQNRWQ